MPAWDAFALTGPTPPSQAVLLAVAAAGVLLASVMVAAARRGPDTARAWLLIGLLVAGLGPLAAEALPLLPADTRPDTASAGLAQWGTAVLGLLCVGAGAERLAAARGTSRRGARALEAAALALTAAGIVAVTLGTLRATPAPWSAALPAPDALAADGTAVALLGAVGVVGANASGRASGPVPYGRRAGLALAGATFALTAAVALPRAAVLLPTGWPAAALPLAPVAGLLLLGWCGGRALSRPAAADYWRAARRRSARRRRGAAGGRYPARLAATPPRGTASAMPPLGGAMLGLAPVARSATPFTPPALRREVLAGPPAAGASVELPATTPGRPAGPVVDADPPGALTPGPSPTAVGEGGRSAVGEGDGGGAAPGIPAAPGRPPYSPQFLAAVLHLQAETARAGHAYRFDQLVDLFSAVRPRAEGNKH